MKAVKSFATETFPNRRFKPLVSKGCSADKCHPEGVGPVRHFYALKRVFCRGGEPEDESSAMGQSYEIVSVQSAEPPPGAEGQDWHCYVIAFEGTNTIHGHRQGKFWAVTREVEEIVAQLNKRHYGHFDKRGRVHITLGKKTDE